jgi:hypothetical protein
MHETLHRCGYILRPESWGLGLRGSTFVSNVDELVTELAARQILAVDLGITASAIYCTSASRGSYDELIIATARALCWAVDCTEREAIDRLARAALRLRRDTPVSDALTALGRLVELAADEPAVSL